MFVCCNGLKTNRVGRSVKICIFFDYFFVQKCVYAFFVDWQLRGWKKL